VTAGSKNDRSESDLCCLSPAKIKKDIRAGPLKRSLDNKNHTSSYIMALAKIFNCYFLKVLGIEPGTPVASVLTKGINLNSVLSSWTKAVHLFDLGLLQRSKWNRGRCTCQQNINRLRHNLWTEDNDYSWKRNYQNISCSKNDRFNYQTIDRVTIPTSWKNNSSNWTANWPNFFRIGRFRVMVFEPY